MDNRFDGFSINMFVDEDGQYMTHFIEIPEVSAAGDTPEASLTELKKAWELTKVAYKSSKKEIPTAPAAKEYNGLISLRVSKELHRRLLIQSKMEKVSLNALINKLLNQTTI